MPAGAKSCPLVIEVEFTASHHVNRVVSAVHVQWVEVHFSRRHDPLFAKFVLNETFLVLNCNDVSLLSPFLICRIIHALNILCCFAQGVLFRIATLPDNHDSGCLACVIVTIDVDIIRVIKANHGLIKVVQVFKGVDCRIEEAIFVFIVPSKSKVTLCTGP